ncbi:MAG: septum formation initiator family protein [Eubacterium sp.]|nr:septum formation initiator family protein [Eubacterium sp.]MCM1216661.1 septum formation initiator family protein [Lachnospiraceae bacterium]MCM1303135.1 septum formation initiator family protein [Butyrivibrio sp.]MCM1342804.1 septum formation initiator family protein [Muribaculaceae bacterium]MCM1240415.1 septum formation initiator family protein [Lachnospiraceae bacterium]
MARRVAYRKRHQNRFSMFLVTLVVVMVMTVVAVRSVGLRQKIDLKRAELALLEAQIEEESLRTLEIEEFAKEVQTKGYIENIAREKLGLVYEGEILFKQDD